MGMLKKFSNMESSKYIEQWFLYVNWIPYMDMMAREVGCIPRSHWLFTNPILYFTVLLSPVTTFHYRLVGHGAKPKLARDVIDRLPKPVVSVTTFSLDLYNLPCQYSSGQWIHWMLLDAHLVAFLYLPKWIRLVHGNFTSINIS